ncbi:MAG: ATP-binding protein [Actinomycetaceae bacterium]|nr:ATP-binding protein [Actinomycetaceae bacterium]
MKFPPEEMRIRVVIVGDDSRNIATTLEKDLGVAFPHLIIDRVNDLDALVLYNTTLGPKDLNIMGAVTSEVPDIDWTLATTRTMPHLSNTSWLVLTDRAVHTDLGRTTSDGRAASLVRFPWKGPLLFGQAYSVMARRLHCLGVTDTFITEFLGPPPPTAVHGPLLEGLDHREHDLMERLLDWAEDVLGPRTRVEVPAGVDLTRQGEPVAAVHFVLDGRVSLHRDTEHGELLLHHATSGPLIGLVSLARGEDAFFTSTTTTPTTVVRLSNEQLKMVLAQQPGARQTLAVLAIQSLTRRLIRAEDLHMEKDQLAADLEEERAKLASTLEALQATRAQLVDKTRFAMLGELSAGIAHELNNPVTALARAAEHLAEDIASLLGASPGTATAANAMDRSLAAAPRSTAEERATIAAILPAVGNDRALARRLVRAGIADPAQAKRLARSKEGELKSLEAGARVGSSLRSILAASERVISLTTSLKGYARPEADEARDIDIRAGIDDVLRLTHYRLHGIHVETAFAEVPKILGHASKLEQVWTNLLVNSAEAIEDEVEDCENRGVAPARGQAAPRIDISVQESAGGVLVDIHDNGPGIPDALLEKIFEPHFTTKAGRVRYGLGMGMSICRTIVADHGGTLTVDSHPGSTHIRVHIPIAGASTIEEE